MSTEAGVLLLILAQTAALFYWGGQVTRTLREHDREILRLRDKYGQLADDVAALVNQQSKEARR